MSVMIAVRHLTGVTPGARVYAGLIAYRAAIAPIFLIQSRSLCGSSSMAEQLPSKQQVAGSSPVSRF